MKLTFNLEEEGWPWELEIAPEGGGRPWIFRGIETPEIPGLSLAPAPEEPVLAKGRPSKYDEDFKAKAIALAKSAGIAQAAKELGIPYGTVWKWAKK